MSSSAKNILVTGADGFIGSHLTEALVRKGYKVRAFCQYNSFGKSGWLDYCDSDVRGEFETILGDIRDPHQVKDAMRNCDAVFNLAALIAIPYSYRSPDSYLETNVKGTLNILQASRELENGVVIQASTSEVYGTAETVPINETHRLNAQSPYAASKIAADQFALSFNSSFALPVLIVRPFNTYGPRQSMRAVIPSIIRQIALGAVDIKLGSLEPTRDFSHVDDTVAGFIASLESERGSGDVFNLGSNFEISIGETAGLIAKIMGSDVNITSDERRIRPSTSEVDRLFSDNKKALNLLPWKPRYTGLAGFEAGLRKTIDWFTEFESLNDRTIDSFNL